MGDGKVTAILQVKGYESEQDRAKESVAQRWIAAVNSWGEVGEPMAPVNAALP